MYHCFITFIFYYFPSKHSWKVLSNIMDETHLPKETELWLTRLGQIFDLATIPQKSIFNSFNDWLNYWIFFTLSRNEIWNYPSSFILQVIFSLQNEPECSYEYRVTEVQEQIKGTSNWWVLLIFSTFNLTKSHFQVKNSDTKWRSLVHETTWQFWPDDSDGVAEAGNHVLLHAIHFRLCAFGTQTAVQGCKNSRDIRLFI